MAPFDEAGFCLNQFSTEHVDLPASISRSVRARQAEFLHGRLAARAALQEWGIAGAQVPIGPSGEPVWPLGIVGSISHTGSLAAAVLGLAHVHIGLGLDVESVVSPNSLGALCSMVLDTHESAYLGSLAGAVPMIDLVTLAFSAKESFYKATVTSVARFLEFDAVQIAAIDFERRLVDLTVTENLHSLFPRGRKCRVSYRRLPSNVFLTAFEAA